MDKGEEVAKLKDSESALTLLPVFVSEQTSHIFQVLFLHHKEMVASRCTHY